MVRGKKVKEIRKLALVVEHWEARRLRREYARGTPYKKAFVRALLDLFRSLR